MKQQTTAKSYHYFDALNFQHAQLKKIEKNKYLKNVQANISLDIHIGKEAASFKLELRGLKWVVIQKWKPLLLFK